jgi:hypothetical protein
MQLHLFFEDPHEEVLRRNFQNSELGRLYLTIPFRELAAQFGPNVRRKAQGVKAIFSIEGGLGLMFLKHYSGLSDAKLIEQLNTNWHYQMFCGLVPKVAYGIKDKDIVGRWRRFFGLRLDIASMQKPLATAWKEDLSQKNVSMQDATVYESYIKFPTDVKLLWDCVEWVRAQITSLCARHRLPVPRSKYKEQRIKQLSFSKQRKKTHKQERRRRAALLYLLAKVLRQLQSILNLGASVVEGINPRVFERLRDVRCILQQQRYHYEQPEKPVPNRIVSLYKPYLRPIVRGKENKPVEFGAKVNQLQVGGCNFIEHLDFEAFHEGNRLNKGIMQHRQWFGPVRQVAADGIYATNRNRRWCHEQQIATSFKPKGRQGKNKEQKKALRDALSVIRGTIMEGSFGNEKNHYLLRKVKARTKETEIAWIFFGVHTANAVKIAKTRYSEAQLQKKAQMVA